MWITADVDLPQEVVDAHAEGTLVFFVGAGASMGDPSNLPSFESLTKQLAERAGLRLPSDTKEEEFLGSMPANFDVHSHALEIIGSTSAPNATHAALVRLASASPAFRIVTTNYDDLLRLAADAAPLTIPGVWFGPAVPLGDDFEGLVHLHGSLLRPPREAVLTDTDFGRAYLTTAWATRFLVPMFQKFTVLFVGYSHDDLIMRYLALGLPPDTPRYALVDEEKANDPKWQRLGVRPISYPAPNEDHGALTSALEAWDSRVRMGRLEHATRMREIVAADTSLTPVDHDYLTDRLRTEDGAHEFATATTDLDDDNKVSWLQWLEDFPDFQRLFADATETTSSARLAYWFSDVFIAEPTLHGAALRTVKSLGAAFSSSLFSSAMRASEILRRRDEAAGRRWRVFLATSVLGRSAPPRVDLLLPYVHPWENATPLALPELRLATRPYLTLDAFDFSLDSGDSSKHPAAEVSWRSDESSLTMHLARAVEEYEPGAVVLGALLEDALIAAYNLTRDYRGDDDWDPLSFSRSAIEAHPQDEYRHPEDAIIDALRDFGMKARESGVDLADRWWGTELPLFQRLALHLVANDTSRSDDDKVLWLLDRTDLFARYLKHEMYQVLMSTADASAPTRERLLTAALRGPDLPRDIEDRDRHVAYSIFNLLVWLSQHAPNWQEARDALGTTRELHPDFEPREHPDFDQWSWSGFVEPTPPMTAEEFARSVRKDPAHSLEQLLNVDVSERSNKGPRWDDWQDLVRSATALDSATGELLWLEIVRETPVDDRRAGVLNAILDGWSHRDAEDVGDSALTCVKAVTDDARLTDAIGRFLREQGRRRVDSGDLAASFEMRDIARELWDHHSATFAHGYSPDGLVSMAPLYLNSWPGHLAHFWLYEIDRCWRQNREDWSGLDDDLSRALRELLDGPRRAQDAIHPALAGHLHFLYVADADFTRENVLSLFTNPDTGTLAWNAYLHHPRFNDSLLAAGLLKATRYAWEYLEQLGDDQIRHQFFGWVAAVASFAGIAEDARRSILNDTVITAEGAYAPQFARAVERLISDTSVNETAVWECWLRTHVEHRLAGRPRKAAPEELAAWADVAPRLGAAIPEAIELFGEDPPGLYDEPSLIDLPESAIASHGSALVDFLAARTRHTDKPTALLAYALQDSIRHLEEALGSAAVAPLRTAAVEGGFIDPVR